MASKCKVNFLCALFPLWEYKRNVMIYVISKKNEKKLRCFVFGTNYMMRVKKDGSRDFEYPRVI